MAVKNDLKKLRKEQRLKQADLAIAVGMCEKSISNIELEKNPASLETALRLAAYFKVSVEDIFHRDFKICCKAKSCFKACRILFELDVADAFFTHTDSYCKISLL